MKFYEFAKILFNYHRGNKYKFVAELLTAGLPDGSAVIDELKEEWNKSGHDRLRKYLSGERDITEIAEEVRSGYKRDAFIEYICEMYKDHFWALVNGFSKNGIEITPGNGAKQIAIVYEEIFSIGGTSNEQESFQPREFNGDDPKFLDLMTKLNAAFATIYSDYLDFCAESPSATEQEKKKNNADIERDYIEFYTHNIQLPFSAYQYPNFPHLNDLYNQGITLVRNFYLLRYNTNTPKLSEEQFKSYQELLAEVIKALDS